MRILIAHNAYQQRGGEDAVVEAEASLLRNNGHAVAMYQRHNDELAAMSRAAAAMSAIWSQQSAREIERLCREFRPDLIHAHNTFPLISPSLYSVAQSQHIPMVQTLHNFRLLCPQAMLLREGAICEDCIGHAPWRAVARKCYRHSMLQTAVLSGALTTHRLLGTYRSKVTRYIVPNVFCRDKFISGGFPPELFRIKPHFVESAVEPQWERRSGGIFAGRLSPEKGLDVLIHAMEKARRRDIRVIGSGPLETVVTQAFGNNYLGHLARDQVLESLSSALFLVAPSICYETFGLVCVEAFSCGTPVIASRHGSFAELVREGVTGLLFSPGDAAELAEKIEWAFSHPNEMLAMGKAARAEYLSAYTPQKNYQMLMDIYEEAMAMYQGVPDVA